MKKLYRLKIYISIVFGLVLSLCAFDYIIINIYKTRTQRIWPIYNWTLGFEKISTQIRKGHIDVISCDSVLKYPVSIQEFIKSQNKKWQDMPDYRYILGLTDIYFGKYKGSEQEIKKLFESNILSQLSCNKMVYSLFVITKNLRTKKEDKILLKTFEYIKRASSLNK